MMIDHRPLYHVRPRAHWINDPNGPIQWGEDYHLFYQYNPHAAAWGTIHWGHVVSRDLVHWAEVPLALVPSPGGPDEGGCWSGCAVDDAGTPTLLYTGVRRDGDGWRQVQCLATSADGLRTWRKYPENPVIATPPPGVEPTDFRDPYVWRDQDHWSCLIGARLDDGRGAALRYTSDDLRTWTYRGTLHAREATLTEPLWTGSMWECPSFFPLGIGDTHVLIVGVYDAGSIHHTAYFAGPYRDGLFAPGEPRRLDYGAHYYAPATFRDARGRRILWGWATEGRPEAAQLAEGWSGAMTLPRLLSPGADGRMGIAPLPELEVLRRQHWHRGAVALSEVGGTAIGEVRGDCLEIAAVIEIGDATEVCLLVRRSPDDGEYTRIAYEAREGRLVVDKSRSSLDPEVDRGLSVVSLALEDGEPLALRVFLDRSVLEVYANGHICLTERIYPTRADSLGIDLTARGAAWARSVDVWELAEAPIDVAQVGGAWGKGLPSLMRRPNRRADLGRG